MHREVTELTSGIFVCGGENFDKAPPVGGIKIKVAPCRKRKILRGPPSINFQREKENASKPPKMKKQI